MQKVLQAATAENDNPDIRDRAYVYWRLLSSDPQIAKVSLPSRRKKQPNNMQNIVLSDKPAITSTIQSLPPQLLEQLLAELSTLASVYHKPPEAFLGQGRFGAEAMQRAAIEYAYPCLVQIMVLTDNQGTTAECEREPNRCSCRGCSCWWPSTTSIKRRKSARHRLRRFCTCVAPKATDVRGIWAGRPCRNTPTCGFSCDRKPRSCFYNERLARSVWRPGGCGWSKRSKCFNEQRRHYERICGYERVWFKPASTRNAAAGQPARAKEQPGAVGFVLGRVLGEVGPICSA